VTARHCANLEAICRRTGAGDLKEKPAKRKK
jgi:hypothetical protein